MGDVFKSKLKERLDQKQQGKQALSRPDYELPVIQSTDAGKTWSVLHGTAAAEVRAEAEAEVEEAKAKRQKLLEGKQMLDELMAAHTEKARRGLENVGAA